MKTSNEFLKLEKESDIEYLYRVVHMLNDRVNELEMTIKEWSKSSGHD